MGPFSLMSNFMFVRWLFDCLVMLYHLLSAVEETPVVISSRKEYFQYLDTVSKKE